MKRGGQAVVEFEVVNLGGLAVEVDELFQIYTALKPASLAELLSLLSQNPHHVLLDPLSTFLAARLSDGPAALRLPSVLLGAAGVWGRSCPPSWGPGLS